tara:strand:- start:3789 stop:4595 length:807 start_codon:yes stop_codon:yes gene_type:complete
MFSHKKFLDMLPELYAICVRAGEFQMKFRTNSFKINTKKNSTPVTDADIEANTIITSCLKKLTPDIQIISEEGHTNESGSNIFWLIDPLDGTSNYIRGGTQFCICIALIEDNSPVVGLIYVPSSNTFYYSYKNKGAFVKNKNLGDIQLFTKKMDSNTSGKIYTSSSINPKILHILQSKMPNIEVIKCSSAIKFGYIASGQGIFYPRIGPTHEWDTAAGDCLVREAGGKIVDKNMMPLKYNKNLSYLNDEFFVLADPHYDWKHIIDLII